MYRENTFEVLKNRHDNFNFNKVLQKRKEFYKYHLPVGSDTSNKDYFSAGQGQTAYPNRKLQYCNDDFVKNLQDKFLLTEITGGEPTYHNQKLYQNIENNLNKMQRVVHPK